MCCRHFLDQHHITFCRNSHRIWLLEDEKIPWRETANSSARKKTEEDKGDVKVILLPFSFGFMNQEESLCRYFDFTLQRSESKGTLLSGFSATTKVQALGHVDLPLRSC